MPNAGLWGREGRRARGPLEALGVSATLRQPPFGTDATEGGGMERHYQKCEFQGTCFSHGLHVYMTTFVCILLNVI